MADKRVVLDTNILISAALRPSGSPREVVDTIRSKNGALLFSDETFNELRICIHRPKFDRYVGETGRWIYLAQLEEVSEWVSITGIRKRC